MYQGAVYGYEDTIARFAWPQVTHRAGALLYVLSDLGEVAIWLATIEPAW